MRGFALDNDSAAWLIPTLQANQFAPFELFLKRGEIRHGVGVLYGKDGELMSPASIREKVEASREKAGAIGDPGGALESSWSMERKTASDPPRSIPSCQAALRLAVEGQEPFQPLSSRWDHLVLS